jgi:hypothetical protein
MAISLRFFAIAGAILIVAGMGQALARPRKANETPLERLVNRATIQMVVFVAAGVAGILIGTGVLPLPHFGR